GGYRWDTQNGAYWLLGVLTNDMIVAPRHVAELGTFTGQVTFDLYAGPVEWLRAGNYAVVEFGLSAGEAVSTLVPLSDVALAAPPAAGAPGAGGPPGAGGVTGGAPAGAAPATTWDTTPGDHRGQNGQRFTYACPPNGSGGRGPWGTAVYTDDSSVCRAAVHAGLITPASGGTVMIEVRPGRACYYGSSGQGGVSSSNWSVFEGSFVFVGSDGRPIVNGEAPTATARAQKETYQPGETITVDFSGFPAYPQDWIEISPAGAAEDNYGEYKYLDGKCAGTVQFAALPPGSYEVRGRFNWSEGGMTIRTRAPFTVRSNAVVRPQKATFAEGEPIVVTFEGFPGNAQDWIDLSATGTPDASYGPYKYTEGNAAGTLQFDALAPGTYEIRGRFNNGYDVQARASFTVEATPGPVTPPPNACGRTLGTGIFDKWQGLGGEGGFLGCPTSDEMEAAPSPQGTTGRWVSFAGSSGMIVWHGTGARISHTYEVHGDIAKLYASMGGSASWLGFPISDEYDVAGGRRSDFEGGYILWNATTFETKAYRHGEEPAPPQPPADQYRVTGLNAGWIGMDADVVSKGDALTPDGDADGHFAVEIAIEGSVELKSVMVYSSDAEGSPAGGQTWSTTGGGYWILGVAAGGQLLNAGAVETVGRLEAGTTRLDLYAGNSGYFN
ncbi:MAG TPA: LCCL domain-containing protein, partial [Gemmatimonadota bacterium]|nr:LCCL domain-containing protein [Gemmatimonadota bacterium]